MDNRQVASIVQHSVDQAQRDSEQLDSPYVAPMREHEFPQHGPLAEKIAAVRQHFPGVSGIILLATTEQDDVWRRFLVPQYFEPHIGRVVWLNGRLNNPGDTMVGG